MRSRKRELEALDVVIAERTQYLAIQEKYIAEAIEEGNLKLRTLHYEITEDTHVIKELKVSLGSLKEDIFVTKNDIQAIRDEFAIEESTLQTRIDTLVIQAEQASSGQAVVVQQRIL